jgi:hypothetical protein
MYYLKTKEGFISTRSGDVKFFESQTEARHFAINYCDLSDRELEILKK